MRRAPLLAIAWELWAKHRRANLAVLAAIPLCSLGYRMAAKQAEGLLRGDLLAVALLPMLASLLWLFSLFSCTESDARRGFTGLPSRFFTLPVWSSGLVGVLTGLGALTTSLLYLAWAKLVFAPAGVTLPAQFPAAALATCMVFFQAVVWGLASFPWLRIIVLVAGGFGFLVLNVVGLSGDVPWARSETARALVVLAFMPPAYGAALFGVHAERSGGWQVWPWLRALVRWPATLLPRRTSPFLSASGAQFWFEWRRKGWFLGLAIAWTIAGAVTLLPISAMIDSGPGLPLMGSLTTFLVPILVAGGVGIGLAKSDYWSKELALRPFQAQRPMTCAGLVIAKFKAAAVISLLGWVAAAPLIWGITLLPRWRELWHSAELTARTLHSLPADRSLAIWTCAGALFLAVLLTWKTMVESLALGLTGRLAGVLSRSVARGIFVVILLSITAWLGRHPSQLALFAPWAFAAAGLLTLWKVFGTARAFSLLRQQRLLAPGGIAALSFLWVGFAVSLGAALFLAQLRAGGLHPVVALAVAGFWPDGSFGRAILNLQSSRHR